MTTRHIVFVINLLQDINILRPLAYMAARDLRVKPFFLVTSAFRKRDKTGVWQQELDEIVLNTQSEVANFDDEFDALNALNNKTGMLIAASESHLNAHKPVHDLFRIAPSRFQKVTLQHGFECVGFLQSRDQDLAHGSNITFAADIICGWCSEDRLSSIAPSQRHKLYVAGPTAVLQTPAKGKSLDRSGTGIICENMHSPRLNVAGDFKTDFLDIFSDFCNALQEEGRKVVLRPHPGGQYTLKNKVSLEKNVEINNAPIYKVDLSQYAYGISAPSSILIDMVMAGIPTAVWQDGGNVMDLGNYEGLTRISSLQDWLDFSHQAVSNPEQFIEAQQKFIARQELVTSAEVVYHRYATLLAAESAKANPIHDRTAIKERILFIANAYIPTLQLSFIKPLAALVESGVLATDLISVEQIKNMSGKNTKEKNVRSWMKRRFEEFDPTLVVFCRYNGKHAVWLRVLAEMHRCPVIYHIDDDLLHIPEDIGEEKHRFHNMPHKLATVHYLLDNATLVYSSTSRLEQKLKSLAISSPTVAGEIYCAGEVITKATLRPVRKIGYMASADHVHNLTHIIGALVRYMRKHTNVDFEFFGSITPPAEFMEFGDRIKMAQKIDNYQEFLQRFSEYEWDIGICPLAPIHFNLMKANTKWVEYTSIGAAVVASKGTVYDECCADGCGMLAQSEDEWFEALDKLTEDPQLRYTQVELAQKKLSNSYSIEYLRNQVLDVFSQAHNIYIKSRIFGNHQPDTLQRISAKEDHGIKPQSIHDHPEHFYRRYAGYLDTDSQSTRNSNHLEAQPERILYIANALIPTLQLSFIKPLAPLVETGRIITDLITEEQIILKFGKKPEMEKIEEWIEHRFAEFKPSLVIFCRYSGTAYSFMLNLAMKHRAPVIYHIDDDLLNIPEDIGIKKSKYHNQPERLQSVRYLLNNANLVYCSTSRMKARLQELSINAPVVHGEIYCSGHVIKSAENRPVRKIGYMGIGHENNLASILPALVRILETHQSIEFEFFGTIPVPEEFKKFGERIILSPKIDNYQEFLIKFSEFNWDIGICPLTSINFNLLKANTKWVEYTSVGAAVVASADTVYNECCKNGCGTLCATEEEWYTALERLVTDPDARFNQVRLAQMKLVQEYSTERLREQVLDIFLQAHSSFINSPPRSH